MSIELININMKNLSFEVPVEKQQFVINPMIKEYDHHQDFINQNNGKVNISLLNYDKNKLFESEGIETCLK